MAVTAEELAALLYFRWNVLQAFDRGGDAYLRNAVEWLVTEQGLDVDAIVRERAKS